MKQRVGIRELAAHLGVSTGSVSKALNRPEQVSEKMRERVLTAADELGFVRNDVARQLKTGSSTTIGMVVLDIANPFFARLASACQRYAEAEGCSLVLASSEQDTEREDRFVSLFEGQRVRGILAVPIGEASATMRGVAARGMPVVLLKDVRSGGDRFCSVALDGELAGQLGVDHLKKIGRTRIAFVGGPRSQISGRLQSAAAASEANGIAFEFIETQDQTINAGSEIGDLIRARPRHQRPDAVFAANDLIAMGVLQSLQADAKIRIPQDIAILGVDDIEYAASANIPLTTIRQPLEDIAREAVRLLLEHVVRDEHHWHRRLLLQPELVVRASTVAER